VSIKILPEYFKEISTVNSQSKFYSGRGSGVYYGKNILVEFTMGGARSE
jgi:hypothetical protein